MTTPFYKKTTMLLICLIVFSLHAYKLNITPDISCKNTPILETEVKDIENNVALAFTKFESVFPIEFVEDVLISVRHFCEIKPESNLYFSQGKGELKIYHFSRSQNAAARNYLKIKLMKNYSLDDADVEKYTAEVEDYIAWQSQEFFMQVGIFHELLHALEEKTNLRELFKSYINPDFFTVNNFYETHSVKIKNSYRAELENRFIKAGHKKLLPLISLAEEGGPFNIGKRCYSSKSLKDNKPECEILDTYNQEIMPSIGELLNSISRNLKFEFGLPYRTFFDDHVYDTGHATEENYMKEFMAISGEAAFYPFKNDFYQRQSEKSKRIYDFWSKTNFKEELR